MHLSELVKMRGFDPNTKIKLVRHKDANYDIKRLYKTNQLDFYQSTQSKNVFDNCDYIMSFIGDEGTKAIYIGTYKKISVEKLTDDLIPPEYPYIDDDLKREDHFYYKLEKTDLLDDLIDRLVIDWGKSAISWYQWFNAKNDKKVVEILPKGYVRDFSGFDNVLLSFDELEKIIKNKDANRNWHDMLRSVAGIYLIIDTQTGMQYIGSAYGEEGILGRWKDYVQTKHGGNMVLVDLITVDPERYKKFEFSILQTLPRSMNKDLVIRTEQLYKRKLGSRAFGLNGN